MESILNALRLAFRCWWRQPLIGIAVILCLGIGIGITAVVFSLINGILLRPLPYQDPDGIFLLWNRFPAQGDGFTHASGWEYLDFRDQTQIFEEVGGVITWSYNLTSIDPPERLTSGRVSASLFRVLGVQPMLGRVFTDEEEKRGDPVVVLSHALWQRAFGSDPEVLGRSLSISRKPYTIIGVMPPDLRPIPIKAELWVPLVPNPRIPRDLRGVLIVTRLKDGVDLERANNDLDVLETHFRRDHPALYPQDSSWELVLQPLHEAFVTHSQGRLWSSLGMVALVLLLACANIANLLLVTHLSRQQDHAVRIALGATRFTLLRQLLLENLILTVIGGVLGWWLAKVGLRLIVAIQPNDMLRLDEVAIDLPVVFFIFGLALMTGLIFGFYPAWRIAGQNLNPSLGESGRTSVGQQPFFRWVAVVELALAVIVLIGTGLMWHSFKHLQRTDPGFRSENLLTMMLRLPRRDYPEASHKQQFYTQLETGLIGRFGEDRVGLISRIPLSRYRFGGPILAEHQESIPNLNHPEVGWRTVSPTFFPVMGIELLQGRTFDSRDHEKNLPVVIIDDKIAKRLWPNENPLGKRLRLDASHNATWRTVVGVVEPIKQQDLAAEPHEQIYMPFLQFPQDKLGIVLHSTANPAPTVDAVRGILRKIDPYLPISDIESIDKLVERSLSGPRFLLTLFATFGVIALLLAAAGIYGVIAYTTAQRTGEIGLRQALGARREDIFALILRQGLQIAALGISLGVALALACTSILRHALASLTFGVDSPNLGIFSGVAILLLALVLIASLVPALRAARLDPATALQRE